MDYRIIATLGPASSTESIWSAMLAEGVTELRLNTSHLSLKELSEWLERLSEFRLRVDQPVPVILDLQGSKWRLGLFAAFLLEPGETIDFILGAAADRPNILPVPHKDFFEAADVSNGLILLNDARMHLMIESVQPERISARVLRGGEITANKGITLASSQYRLETLGEKDRAILAQTAPFADLSYAISFVKDVEEMKRYRSLLGNAHLIAKLERRSAIEDARLLPQFANELWLCRGDLGAEVGLVSMAELAATFAMQIKELPVPVCLAGQVLEHMVSSPNPTRSEVVVMYDALQKGFSGLILSDETAVGYYPLQSCAAAALFRHEAGA